LGGAASAQRTDAGALLLARASLRARAALLRRDGSAARGAAARAAGCMLSASIGCLPWLLHPAERRARARGLAALSALDA
jgi:hypothetical protein